MRDDHGRLRDILEAIERIERHAAAGREPFERDEPIQTWMIHHLQIIGEACRGLSPDFTQQEQTVPWTKIVGMRKILAHHYFGIDRDALWAVSEKDLPDLKREIAAMLGRSEEPNPGEP